MTPVLQNEGAKPFPQSTRLSGNSVELSRKTISAYRGGCPGGHKLGLRKPSQKAKRGMGRGRAGVAFKRIPPMRRGDRSFSSATSAEIFIAISSRSVDEIPRPLFRMPPRRTIRPSYFGQPKILSLLESSRIFRSPKFARKLWQPSRGDRWANQGETTYVRVPWGSRSFSQRLQRIKFVRDQNPPFARN